MTDFKVYFRHARKRDWSYYYLFLLPTILLWKSYDADEQPPYNDFKYFGIALKWLTFEIEFRWKTIVKI